MKRLDGLRVAAVFAHPDDEAFGPAGTLATCSHLGAEIRIYMATRGEAGRRRGSPPFCRPEELGAVRWSELEKSCRILGCRSLTFLHLRDKGVDRYGPEHVERLSGLWTEYRPHVIIALAPDGGLAPHPDHKASSRLAREAWEAMNFRARLCYYQRQLDETVVKKAHGIWPGLLVVDVASSRREKLLALKAHRTQTEQVGSLWREEGAVIRRLSRWEHFLVPEPGLSSLRARGEVGLLFPYVPWRHEKPAAG